MSSDASTPLKPRRWRWFLLALVSLMVIGFGGVVARTMQLAARAESQSKIVEQHMDDYEARLKANPWRPKPLRGASHEGNAFEEVQTAMDALGDGGPNLQGMNRPCAKPTDTDALFLEANAKIIDELRRAASADHSRVPLDLRADPGSEMPSVRNAMRAHQILAAKSRLAPPRECVEIAADALRLAQSLSPGGALFTAAVSSAIVVRAAGAMVECLVRADQPVLQQAARELALAEADHPTLGAGRMLESEFLFRANFARHAATFDFLLPLDSTQKEAFWLGGDLLDAQAWCIDQLPTVRAIDAMSYPEAGRRWDEVQAAQTEEGKRNVFLGIAAPQRVLEADQRSLAWVRVVTEFAQRLAAPSSEEAGSLVDPFSGEPLRVDPRVAGNLRVWSVGPDGRDQAGGGDDLVVEERFPCTEKQ